jgi:hypothetical protein
MRSSAPIAMHRQYVSGLAENSESQYLEDLNLRDLVRHFPSVTICRSGFPMTTAVGLDHRVLLPPFLPVCRNQDGLFITVLKRIHPQGYFAHLPFALAHESSGLKINDPTWTSSTRIADQIKEFVAAWPEPPGRQSADSRCRSLGTYLIGISRMTQSDFEEMTRIVLMRRTTRLIRDCEAAIARHDSQPEFWVRDLSDRIVEMKQSTVRADFTVPSDLSALFPLGRTHAKTQQLIRKFGKLLYWWPEIVKVTRNLAEGRVRLGREI